MRLQLLVFCVAVSLCLSAQVTFENHFYPPPPELVAQGWKLCGQKATTDYLIWTAIQPDGHAALVTEDRESGEVVGRYTVPSDVFSFPRLELINGNLILLSSQASESGELFVDVFAQMLSLPEFGVGERKQIAHIDYSLWKDRKMKQKTEKDSYEIEQDLENSYNFVINDNENIIAICFDNCKSNDYMTHFMLSYIDKNFELLSEQTFILQESPQKIQKEQVVFGPDAALHMLISTKLDHDITDTKVDHAFDVYRFEGSSMTHESTQLPGGHIMANANLVAQGNAILIAGGYMDPGQGSGKIAGYFAGSFSSTMDKSEFMTYPLKEPMDIYDMPYSTILYQQDGTFYLIESSCKVKDNSAAFIRTEGPIMIACFDSGLNNIWLNSIQRTFSTVGIFRFGFVPFIKNKDFFVFFESNTNKLEQFRGGKDIKGSAKIGVVYYAKFDDTGTPHYGEFTSPDYPLPIEALEHNLGNGTYYCGEYLRDFVRGMRHAGFQGYWGRSIWPIQNSEGFLFTEFQ
jgi:hypothetical protein